MFRNKIRQSTIVNSLAFACHFNESYLICHWRIIVRLIFVLLASLMSTE